MSTHSAGRLGRAAECYRAARQAASTYRPADAARLYRQALRLLPEPAEPTDPAELVDLRVRALIGLAYNDAEISTFTAGMRHLRAAEAALAAVADPALRLDLDGLVSSQRGLMLYRAGRLAESVVALTESLARHEQSLAVGGRTEASMGRTLMNRAMVHLGLGEPTPAARDLRRCVELAAEATDPNHAGGLVVLAAKARHALGSLAWRTGDIPLALRYQEEAGQQYRALSPTMLPKLRMDQAEILLSAGLAEEAARHLDEVLPELRRLRDYTNLAEAETVRAAAAVIDGEYPLARRLAGTARRRFLRRHNDSWAAVAALTGLRAQAADALDQGRVPAALPSRAVALSAELAERGLPDESSVAVLLAVRLWLRRGAVAAAAAQLAALPRPRRVTPVDHLMLRRLARAELAVAQGDRRAALRQARSGLAVLAQVRDRMGGLELVSGTATHGWELGELAVRLVLDAPRAAPARLFDWLERTRAQVYRYEPAPPPENPVLAERLRQYRGLTRELQRGQVTGSVTEAQRARQSALRREVMRLGWRDEPWGRSRPPAELAEVTAALGDAVLVSYVASGPDLAALVIADGRCRLVRLAGLDRARTAARELHADLDALAPDVLPDPVRAVVADSARRRAAVLDDVLIRPWQDVLGERDLVVVPTGPLYAVAWGVLPALRGRPVSVAPSATAWLAATRAGGGADRPTALVAAPGLAAAVGEVGGLRRHHPDAVLLTGAAATVPAVLAALDGAGLAHLAAHGAHEPDNELFSKLELADGPLFAHETLRLRRPPEHVVLAACELALSRIRAGDEALGFAGALLSAGVRSVTAAVTRVGDAAAAAAMADYHRLLAGGAAPAEALARTIAADPYRRPFVCFGAG
jgi:tetratricopeptide (TPR) repeat protein